MLPSKIDNVSMVCPMRLDTKRKPPFLNSTTNGFIASYANGITTRKHSM